MRVKRLPIDCLAGIQAEKRSRLAMSMWATVPDTNAGLGGNDFGVADSGSWDDGFSGGAGGGDSWT